jgi:hypothetical protein
MRDSKIAAPIKTIVFYSITAPREDLCDSKIVAPIKTIVFYSIPAPREDLQ